MAQKALIVKLVEVGQQSMHVPMICMDLYRLLASNGDNRALTDLSSNWTDH